MAATTNIHNDGQGRGSQESGGASNDVMMQSTNETECDNTARERMLTRIASGKATVKSQQRDEEDPSPEEKLTILRKLLDHKPAIFLERFHAFLREDDLGVFSHHSGDYEIEFYLKEARKRLLARKPRTGVRNRRYEALKQLEKEGTYFEDKAMKDRDPLMFEEYVGQYMTAEEKKGLLKPIDLSDLRFSSILMTFMDEQETKLLHKRQKEAEDDMMEEEEEEEDEEEEDEEEEVEEEEEDGDEEEDDDDNGTAGTLSSHTQQANKPTIDSEPTPASEEEKALMRQEFLHHMHLRFLSGQEKDFDYSAVDGNAEYDSLVLRTQDEEEHYFDDEEEETWSLEEAERRQGDEDDQDVVDYCDLDVMEMERTCHESRTDDTDSCSPREKKSVRQPTVPVEKEGMES